MLFVFWCDFDEFLPAVCCGLLLALTCCPFFCACVWFSRLSFCGTLVPTSEAWNYCFLMRLRSGFRYGPTLWECASNLPYLRPCPCCAETRVPLSDPKYLQAKQYWSDWMFSAYHLCQFEQLSGDPAHNGFCDETIQFLSTYTWLCISCNIVWWQPVHINDAVETEEDMLRYYRHFVPAPCVPAYLQDYVRLWDCRVSSRECWLPIWESYDYHDPRLPGYVHYYSA